MRVLVGWDNPQAADLIAQYLNVGENESVVCTDSATLLTQAAERADWDALLLATQLSPETNFELFQRLHAALPETPIIGVCDPQGVYRLARYLTAGMKSYILRDDRSDFIFLMQATVDNVVAAVRNEREQRISERLREEIESVRKLQQSIIPENIPAPPGYGIRARYEPSQVRVIGGQSVVLAGGDYYDIIRLDDTQIVILVGDASGHGMKACMSIMTMHTLMGMLRSEQYKDPASLVADVNRRLCGQRIISNEGGFITLLYAVLNFATHELRWSTAGHPVPVIHDLATGCVTELGGEQVGGLPLGLYEDAEYGSYSSVLPAHHRLLIYTDGLVEAFPHSAGPHAQFGLTGVTDTLRRGGSLSLAATLQSLFDDSHSFTEGAGRHDDTSMVLLERL